MRSATFVITVSLSVIFVSFLCTGIRPALAEQTECSSAPIDSSHIDWISKPQKTSGLQQEKLPSPDKACVMVIHGLNNKASVMDSLIGIVTELGFDTERVTLLGHRENDSLKEREIKPEDWPRQIRSAYCELKSRCESKPIYNISFSLGALSTTTFLNHFSDARFDGMLLFAPAITITSWSSLLKLVSPFRYIGIPLPSFMPENYQAHSLTTIWMYDSLFQLSDSIVHLRNRALGNIPTKIIIHPDDFLVNADGLRDWVRENELEKWEMVYLKDATKHWTNHLIVTPEFVSSDDWKIIIKSISNSFNLTEIN